MQDSSEVAVINNDEFNIWEYIQLHISAVTGFTAGTVFIGIHHFVDDHIYENTPFEWIISSMSFITASSFCMEVHRKCGKCGDVLHVAIGGGVGVLSSIAIDAAYHTLTFANSFIPWDYIKIKWDYVKNNNMLPIEAFVIGGVVARSITAHYLMEEQDFNTPFVARILGAQFELAKDSLPFEVFHKVFGNTAICFTLYMIGGLDAALVSTVVGVIFDLQIGSVNNFIHQTWEYLENNYIVPCTAIIVTGIGGYYASWNVDNNSLLVQALILLMDPIANTKLFEKMYHENGHIVPAVVSAISGFIISIPPIATTIAECYDKTKFIGNKIYEKTVEIIENVGLYKSYDEPMFVFD